MKIIKAENIEYETLKGFDKAAILINYLGKEAIKVLLRRMEDGDIRKLISVMGKYRVVPVHVTKKVLEEFYEMVSESEDYIFSEEISIRSGSSTVNVVPSPKRVSTRIVPPCRSTMLNEMESPNPVPSPTGLVVKNGSKI